MKPTSDILRENDLHFGNLGYLESAMHGLDLEQKHLVESVIIGCIAALTPIETWHRVVNNAVKTVRNI